MDGLVWAKGWKAGEIHAAKAAALGCFVKQNVPLRKSQNGAVVRDTIKIGRAHV